MGQDKLHIKLEVLTQLKETNLSCYMFNYTLAWNKLNLTFWEKGEFVFWWITQKQTNVTFPCFLLVSLFSFRRKYHLIAKWVCLLASWVALRYRHETKSIDMLKQITVNALVSFLYDKNTYIMEYIWKGPLFWADNTVILSSKIIWDL